MSKFMMLAVLSAGLQAATITNGDIEVQSVLQADGLFHLIGDISGPAFALDFYLESGAGPFASIDLSQTLVAQTFVSTASTAAYFILNDNGSVYSSESGSFLTLVLNLQSPVVNVTPGTPPDQGYSASAPLLIITSGSLKVTTKEYGQGTVLFSDTIVPSPLNNSHASAVKNLNPVLGTNSEYATFTFATPEPATWGLMAAGLGLVAVRRRR